MKCIHHRFIFGGHAKVGPRYAYSMVFTSFKNSKDKGGLATALTAVEEALEKGMAEADPFQFLMKSVKERIAMAKLFKAPLEK